MKAEKHTPGPWVVEQLKDRHNGYDWKTFTVRNRPGNHCLATIGETDRATAKNNEANARLIAKAPEMLEALKMSLRLIEGEELDEKFDGETTIIRDLLAEMEE